MTSHTIITNPWLDLICASITRFFGFSSSSVSRVTTSHDHLLISHPKLSVPFPARPFHPLLFRACCPPMVLIRTIYPLVCHPFRVFILVYCPVSSSPLPTNVLYHRCWSSLSHLTTSSSRGAMDVRLLMFAVLARCGSWLEWVSHSGFD